MKRAVFPLKTVCATPTKERCREDNVPLDLLQVRKGLPGEDIARSVVDSHHPLGLGQSRVSGVGALWGGASVVYQDIQS